MKKIQVLVAAAALVAIFVLSGCGRNENVIRVFNWGDFLDESILAEFTAETGIRVIYSTYASNEEMYTRITAGGAQGGGFDLLFPSDYMIERLILENRLSPINFDNIPNMVYVHERFKNLAFDPENRYSVPYKWGTLGILYNRTLVDEIAPGLDVATWDVMFDERFAGSIFMYDSMRDSFAVALIRLGYSINTQDLRELTAARDMLIAQRPLVRAFLGDQVKDAMIGREAALALVFSGCAMFSMGENPELYYAIPREGTNVWYDSMVIPAGARNQEGAEAFINFMLRPDIALRNTMFTGFATTNAGALEMVPQEWRDNPAFWTTDEDYYAGEVFLHLGDFNDQFERFWIEVLAARP